MRSWRGFDTSPTMMRVSSFASCIILPVFLKLKTLPNIPYQEAACTHDICHAHNTRNFTKPSDTLTYDICHGQIRRDFTSDKFFPGLYSNAKAHIANKQVLIQAAAGGGIQKIEAGASPTSACLSDERIRALAALGAGVEALYETPQDIEWTIDPSGQIFLLQAMREAEVHAAASFEHLGTDPRLSLRETPRRVFGRALVLLLARTHLPWYLLQAFLAPQAANTRVQRFVEQVRNAHRLDASADAAAHLAAAERLLLHCLRLAFRVSPVMLAGMQSFALARRMLGELASERECQIVLGGSPTNPTTEMNLALWRLFQEIRADATSRHLLQSLPAETLAQDYQQGRLPAPLQQGVARFLQAYGHQGVCELDLGVPRWSENPTYVLNLLTGYLEIEESAPAPDLQLQRARREAAAMIATLAQRARHKHWLRGQLVRLCLQRAHALAGFRE